MNCEPVSLQTALMRIASQFGLDAVELAEYAAEDTIGGWHSDERQAKWPVGSLWQVEGQILYALVRALKPARVLELGTYHGCSATHIASALKANGNDGRLLCVDNGSDAPGAPAIGYLIPDDLRQYITLVNGDIEEFVTDRADQIYDLIFEDGFHSPQQVKAVWTEIPRLLRVGGVAVSHDACHFIVGDDVYSGIQRAGVMDAGRYLIAPSDCGLAIWKRLQLFGVLPAEEKPKRKQKAKG